MRSDTRPWLNRKPWYSFLMIYVSMAALGVGSVLYSHHVAQESEKKWCSLIGTLNEGYSRGNPTTPIGQKLKSDFAALNRDLGCDR